MKIFEEIWKNKFHDIKTRQLVKYFSIFRRGNFERQKNENQQTFENFIHILKIDIFEEANNTSFFHTKFQKIAPKRFRKKINTTPYSFCIKKSKIRKEILKISTNKKKNQIFQPNTKNTIFFETQQKKSPIQNTAQDIIEKPTFPATHRHVNVPFSKSYDSYIPDCPF